MRDRPPPRVVRDTRDYVLSVLAGMLLGVVAGGTTCGCSRAESKQTPSNKAAPVAPQGSTDDCPGGVCTIPVRRK